MIWSVVGGFGRKVVWMVYIVVGGCVDGVHCGGRLCGWCTLWWEVVWMVYIVVGGCVDGVHCGGRLCEWCALWWEVV